MVNNQTWYLMKDILEKINSILKIKLSYGKDEDGNELADKGPQFSTLGGTLFLVFLFFTPVVAIVLYAKLETIFIKLKLEPLLLILYLYIIGAVFLYNFIKKRD